MPALVQALEDADEDARQAAERAMGEIGPADYRLVFVDGEQMGEPDSKAVPETPAGESALISVEFVAPRKRENAGGIGK